MNQMSLAEYRHQIENTIQDGHYEEAVAHGRHMLEWYPHHVEAYWLLGRAMLESGRDEQATDMFQRVLTANPEHVPAWVGLSEVAERHGDLEEAVWYLQRAFELATDDEPIAHRLRHLYGELEGSEPSRLALTKSALAKLYLRGDLLKRAIADLRQLIEEHPDRFDLRVALAEALWRDGQRLQASQVCQEILDEQPYVLKANLILGEIWSSSGRTVEGAIYLDRAEAVDPENKMAQDLFGSASPLAPQEPQIEPLIFAPAEEPADQPSERAVESTPSALVELETGAKSEAVPAGDVYTGKEEGRPTEGRASEEAVAEKDILDWLRELEERESRPSPAEHEEEVLDWLEEIDAAAEGEEELAGPESVEIPDWLQGLVPPAAEAPDTAPSETATGSVEGEILERPAAEDLKQQMPESEALEEMADVPASIEGDGMPSSDDALAWLARLAEREEPRAQPEPGPEALTTERDLAAARRADEESPPTEEPESSVEEAMPEEAEEEAAPLGLEQGKEQEFAALEERAPAGPPVATIVEEEASLMEEEPVLREEALEETSTEDLNASIAAQQAYAEDHPDDPEAQLELGRVLWQQDKRIDAVEAYDKLIARRKHLDDVIEDLEDYKEQWPAPRLMQSLGDAYMKSDRLQEALDIYRQALASL